MSEAPARNTVSLAGGWALVAGATGKVGAAVASALAARGMNLVLHTGRRHEVVTATAEALADKYGVATVPVTADLTDPAGLERLNRSLTDAGVERLDVLINCVTGFDGRPRQIDDLSIEEFRQVVEADLVVPYGLVRTLLPLLARAEGARVVLLSSLAGLRGRPGAAHLCAAKAGLTGLALALSRDLAEQRVTVNLVAPGPIQPPDAPALPLPPGVVANSPDEVADAVALFAGLKAPVTGQTLIVNGGLP